MQISEIARRLRDRAVVTATILALVGAQTGVAQARPTYPYGFTTNNAATATPIKHVIIIIGENRTFDNVFATYAPKAGQTVWNLLSEGIINADGTPGANYLSKTRQYSATDNGTFQLAPPTKTPYQTLPPFQAGGPYTPYGCQLLGYGSKSSLRQHSSPVAPCRWSLRRRCSRPKARDPKGSPTGWLWSRPRRSNRVLATSGTVDVQGSRCRRRKA